LVDILLGEDFQLNYELSVTRNVEAGTYIQVGRSGYSIQATAVSPTKDFSRLRSSAYSVASFQRGKIHRRNKERKRRAKRKFGELKTTVRASQDYRIFPHMIKSI
jgi:hypothetical protein